MYLHRHSKNDKTSAVPYNLYKKSPIGTDSYIDLAVIDTLRRYRLHSLDPTKSGLYSEQVDIKISTATLYQPTPNNLY